MDANQLGRRNLSPEQMSLLRGRIYNRSKKTRAEVASSAAATRWDANGQNVQQHEPKATHEQLGERFGVSGKTVQRDGQFAASVEALKEFVPDVEERVMSGEVKRRDVLEAVQQPEKAQEILAHNHRAQGTGESVVLLQHDGFTTTTRLDMAGLQSAIQEATGLDIDMDEKQL